MTGRVLPETPCINSICPILKCLKGVDDANARPLRAINFARESRPIFRLYARAKDQGRRGGRSPNSPAQESSQVF